MLIFILWIMSYSEIKFHNLKKKTWKYVDLNLWLRINTHLFSLPFIAWDFSSLRKTQFYYKLQHYSPLAGVYLNIFKGIVKYILSLSYLYHFLGWFSCEGAGNWRKSKKILWSSKNSFELHKVEGGLKLGGYQKFSHK